MDTLKGIIWEESCKGIETWCLAVEDPNNSSHSIVFRCFPKEIRAGIRGFSKKRCGMFKFRAFRFDGKIEKKEKLSKPVTRLMPDVPEECYHQIPITELKKLKEWID